MKKVLFGLLLFSLFSCSSSKDDNELGNKSISFDINEATIVADASLLLKITVTPASLSDNVVWSSSNTSVAQVDKGRVKALKEGTAIIKATLDNISSSCKITVIPSHYGYGYIDMGVSVKWAYCNIGASSPKEAGSYFLWGETTPRRIGDWRKYKFWSNGDDYYDVTFIKYVISPDRGSIDGNRTLELSDDAARANMGGNWRMPTWAECQELADNTDFKTSGNGILLTSKINGKTLFIPFGGYYDTDNVLSPTPRYFGQYAHVWTSSLTGYYDEDDSASAVAFSYLANGKENGWAGMLYRMWSCPVRGVFK
ncbi:MAG: Ig-like domain-containing protein [Bacteroidales bacterium]|nr:Ig-like domain-containing protein [Bacteroidales bacterium]